ASLARVLGIPGAVLMGLGSIVGTGIFVSIGTAAGVAQSAVLIAVALAAVVATCNGLSSAQLAAAHPVSGGAYEYGYRYATPTLGFVAGWMFVCAKTASAATAALGFGGYALALFGHTDRVARVALAVMAVITLTVIVIGGLKRSSRMNAIIVAITLASLLGFVVAGLPHLDASHFAIAGGGATLRGVAHATALMFVAYTGYGRIATLGEEVRDPARTIPRAIVITLVVALVLYLAVTAVAVGAVGGEGLAAATQAGNAPLETIAMLFASPVRYVVAVGAVTAMLGVILNLVLGISRVVLAMARRGDLPKPLATVHGSSPRAAVLLTGGAIAALALIGSVETTWSFSAFTVLVYYAIANLCALRQPRPERRFPRAVPIVGLASCLGLAFWVEPKIWIVGLSLIAIGVIARSLLKRS
ncbi:MAG TPA: APC family permease, partial [Kofleriaceae bacterium]